MIHFFSEKDTFFKTLAIVSIVSITALFLRVYIIGDYDIFVSEDQINVWSLRI